MSEFTATQIPKPANEQDFEAANEILWRCLLQTESVQLHGRRGQKQDGVDLFGIRAADPCRIVGVQAKLKSDGSFLDEKEVEAEVEKALKFKPLLSEYYIVTTSPDDARLNQLALDLSVSASAGRLIPLQVRVYGWETMQREIRRHPEALKAFDPSRTSHGDLLQTTMESLAQSVDTRIDPKIDEILSLLKGGRTVDITDVDARDTPSAEPEIDGYAALVRSEPATALILLRGLQGRLGASASGRVRFRVAANIAACQLELGDVEEGIKGLIDAYDLDPTNPKAASNKAMALLLSDDWPALKAFAIAILPTMPDNAQLAGYFVQGGVGREDASFTDGLLPPAVQQSPEVLISKIRRAMDEGEPGAWHDLAIEAHQRYPADDTLDEIHANALLERVLAAEGFRYGRVLTAAEVEDATAACATLQRHWDRTKAYRVGDSRKYVSLPLNLITAYRLVHQTQDALKVAREAMVWLPGNKDIIARTAAVLLEAGDRPGAEALLDSIGIDGETVQMRFNLAMNASQWARVVELVTNHLDLFPEHDRGMVRASSVAAQVELSEAGGRQAVLEANRDAFAGDARGNAILAQSARQHGFDALSDHFFTQGVLALNADASFADRMAVADEAMKRAEPGVVADILLGHVDITRDGPELRLIADALAHDFPIRARAATFFESLPPQVRDTAAFKRMEAIYTLNRGETALAIPLLQDALRLAPHATTLVLLISAHLQLDQAAAVGPLISDPAVESLPGPRLERMKLAQVMMDYGDKERAIALGYSVLCASLDRAPVVLRYFGLVLKPQPTPRLGFDAVVAIGNWVKFTRADGVTYEGIIGEEVDRPWGARIDPSNVFIAAALGVNEGATFSVENTMQAVETWTVTEVKPRWLQAFHVLSATFNQRFPEAQGFQMLTMREGDITPTLDQVRRTSEAIREHADVYLQQNIPMALVADNRSGGAVGFAEYLRSIGEEIRTCVGDAEERDRAFAVIDANVKRGAVLDGLTAWRAAELDVLEVLQGLLGPLAIPSTELNRLKAIVDDEESTDTGERMRLSYHDGQFYRETISAEDRAANKKVLVDRLAKVEIACTPEPVVIPDTLPEIAELVLQFPAGDAIAPLILAGQQRVLVCEDLAMRQLGQQAFNTRGVWLQAVLLAALDRGAITLDRYADAMVLLAAHRHGFLAINVAMLQSVYARDGTSGLYLLQALLHYLGSAKADPRSHLSIACHFLNGLWDGRTGVPLKVEAATGHVMRALLARPRGDDWARWAGALWMGLDAGPRSYFRGWLRGHFLPWPPVEEAIREARSLIAAGRKHLA